MLLEAAMAELRPDASPSPLCMQPNIAANHTSPLQTGKSHCHPHQNMVELKDMHAHFDSANADIASPQSNGESSLHSKEGSSDEFSSSNAGSSISTNFCDDTPSHYEGLSLLQDDNEFVSRVLHREPSNLGESSRFGSYRSTAAVAAGGVPFQWEAEPGKCKNPTTIKEEEEELVAPLSLPPIRLAAAAHMPPHMSPSNSTTPSPRSLTRKVKSLLINHVKKTSIDHFSFSSILDTQKSPLKRSPHRATRKERRRTSSLSASEHASLSSSPYNNYTTTFIRNGANVQRNEEVDNVPGRESVNSSDPSSSPYYFSPLSNASSYMSQGLISPRISVAHSLSGSTTSIHTSAMGSLHTSSWGSDSSVSSVSSAANAPTKAPAMLANCLLRITDMSDNTLPHSLTENRDKDNQNGNSSLSFASPEMEILDEALLTSANFIMQQNNRGMTMAEFINRGGPSMNRSFSTSRVTFADDLHRMPALKSKYYSAQLSNLAQPKSTHISPMKDSTHYNANLDVLFPLKRPNLSLNHANREFADESPEDRQAYADALDTSLDCSTDNEELNSMVQSIMKVEQPAKERPQEVVMQANDENGYAYSPIASAFVFSPRKVSQNGGAKHYFKPSTRANNGTDMNATHGGIRDQHYNALNYSLGQPKSILKKTYSQELNRTQSLNAKGAGASVMRPPAYVQSKSLSHSSSQKISSVLLSFAEAEEQLYNSKKNQQQNGMRSPACIQPMCSFLGRALLCRSKLASHAGRLHSS